jgi:predicted acetyltransferase
MLKFKIIKKENDFTRELTREDFVNFTYTHLRRFGDSKKLINKSIDYAFTKTRLRGGFLIVALLDDIIVGSFVLNKTGMADFVPENLIVYLAVHIKYFNKGIGEGLINKAFNLTKGSFKLHINTDNPEIEFYKQIGFIPMYYELRFIRK